MNTQQQIAELPDPERRRLRSATNEYIGKHLAAQRRRQQIHREMKKGQHNEPTSSV